MADVKEFFKPGALVYFKKCVSHPRQKSDGMSATNGYAFGILLGVVPPFTPEPTAEVVFSIAAGFGMVTIDSIIELMGEEIGKQYIAKLQQKYAEPSRLVGPDGLAVPILPTSPEVQ